MSTTVRRRTATLGVLAVLSLAATLLVAASSASAAYTTSLKNEQTHACLGWLGGESVKATQCRHFINSSWTLHQWRDGTWQLRATYGGNRCLDHSHIGLRAFEPCWPGSSWYSRYQSWKKHYVAPGIYTLQNQATKSCLDDSPLGLRAIGCNGSRWQWWREGTWSY
jgi:hypothetical protein